MLHHPSDSPSPIVPWSKPLISPLLHYFHVCLSVWECNILPSFPHCIFNVHVNDWRRRRRPRRPMFVRFLVCFGSLSSIACANIRALDSRVRKSDMWENRFESAIRILLCLRVATVVPSYVTSPLSCVYVHSNFPSPHLPFPLLFGGDRPSDTGNSVSSFRGVGVFLSFGQRN